MMHDDNVPFNARPPSANDTFTDNTHTTSASTLPPPSTQLLARAAAPAARTLFLCLICDELCPIYLVKAPNVSHEKCLVKVLNASHKKYLR